MEQVGNYEPTEKIEIRCEIHGSYGGSCECPFLTGRKFSKEKLFYLVSILSRDRRKQRAEKYY